MKLDSAAAMSPAEGRSGVNVGDHACEDPV